METWTPSDFEENDPLLAPNDNNHGNIHQEPGPSSVPAAVAHNFHVHYHHLPMAMPVHPPPNSPVWYNVVAPIETFSGRQTLLHEVHMELLDGNCETGLVHQLIVSGEGGVGKTEFVRKYIKDYSIFYKNIIWINGGSEESMKTYFLNLAEYKLNIFLDEQKREGDLRPILDQVYEKLCLQDTLLVFDDVDSTTFDEDGASSSFIKDFFPNSLPRPLKKPYLIVTSRNQAGWGHLVNQRVKRLDLFSEDEMIQFFYKHLPFQYQPYDDDDIQSLCRELGGLPLVLQQAVAYIRQETRQAERRGQVTSLSIKKFTEMIQQEKGRTAMLKCRPYESSSTTATIFSTIAVTLNKFKKLGNDGAAAIRLLECLALLNFEMIPLRVLLCFALKGRNFWEKRDLNWLSFKENYCQEKVLVFSNGFELLENYCLIRLIRDHPNEDNFITLHRHVAHAIVIGHLKRRENFWGISDGYLNKVLKSMCLSIESESWLMDFTESLACRQNYFGCLERVLDQKKERFINHKEKYKARLLQGRGISRRQDDLLFNFSQDAVQCHKCIDTSFLYFGTFFLFQIVEFSFIINLLISLIGGTGDFNDLDFYLYLRLTLFFSPHLLVYGLRWADQLEVMRVHSIIKVLLTWDAQSGTASGLFRLATIFSTKKFKMVVNNVYDVTSKERGLHLQLFLNKYFLRAQKEHAQRHLDSALIIYRDVHQMQMDQLGPAHSLTLHSLSAVACLLVEKGDLNQAVNAFHQLDGNLQPTVAVTVETGDEEISMLRRIRERHAKLYGNHHPYTLSVGYCLAQKLLQNCGQGWDDEAVEIWRHIMKCALTAPIGMIQVWFANMSYRAVRELIRNYYDGVRPCNWFRQISCYCYYHFLFAKIYLLTVMNLLVVGVYVIVLTILVFWGMSNVFDYSGTTNYDVIYSIYIRLIMILAPIAVLDILHFVKMKRKI